MAKLTAAQVDVKFSSSGAEGVKNDLNDVDKAVSNINSRGGFFKSILSGAIADTAGQYFTSLTDSLVGFGKSMIDQHSNMEAINQRLVTITGSTERATEIMNNMKKLAATSPFEFPELADAAARLEAFGQSAEKWMPVIGDTAAATNKSVTQVTEAILDAQTGEFERLKELGIKTTVEGDKIRFSFMRNGKMMSVEAENNSESISNAIMGIFSQNYSGAMEGLSNTFIGRLSNLKDNVNALLMQATEPIFKGLSSAIGGANKYLDAFTTRLEQGQGVVHSLLWASVDTLRNWSEGLGLGDEWATKITPAIKNIEAGWKRLQSVGRSVGNALKRALGSVFEFLAQHMDYVVIAGKALLIVLGGLAGMAVVGAVMAVISAVLGSVLIPILAITAAVAVLLVAWDKNWFGIRDKTAAVWAVIEPIFDSIKDAVKWIADGFDTGGWGEAWDRTKSVAQDAWNAIKNMVSNIDWGGLLQSSLSVLSGIGTWILNALSGAGNAIADWFSDQFGGVDWAALALGAVDSLAGAVGTAMETAADIASKILDWFTAQIDAVDWSSLGSKVATLLVGAIKGVVALDGLALWMWLKILDAISEIDWGSLASSIKDFLLTAIMALVDFFLGLSDTLYDELVTQITNIDWEALKTVVSDMASGIWDPIADFLSDTVDEARGYISDLIDAYNAIPVLPDIPNPFKEVTAGAREANTVAGDFKTTLEGVLWEKRRGGAIGASGNMNLPGTQPMETAGFGVDTSALGGDSKGGGVLSGLTKLAATAKTAWASIKQDTDAGARAVREGAISIPPTLGTMGQGFVTASTTSRSSLSSLASEALSRAQSIKSDLISNVTTAQTSTVSQFSSMNTQSVAQLLGMRLAAVMQLALFASSASTQGQAFSANLTTAVASGVSQLRDILSQVIGIVRSVGGSAANEAYAFGANISRGFANGMLAYLSVIRNAATQMVNAATTAIHIAGMFGSPSKVSGQYGSWYGEGFVNKMLDKIPDVRRAASRLFGAANPSSYPGLVPQPMMGYTGSGTVVNNYYEDVKVMTTEEWEAYKQRSDKGATVYDTMVVGGGSRQYYRKGTVR